MVVNVNTASGSQDLRDPGTLHNISGMDASSLGTNSQLAGTGRQKDGYDENLYANNEQMKPSYDYAI